MSVSDTKRKLTKSEIDMIINALEVRVAQIKRTVSSARASGHAELIAIHESILADHLRLQNDILSLDLF